MPWTDPRTGERDYAHEERLRGKRPPRTLYHRAEAAALREMRRRHEDDYLPIEDAKRAQQVELRPEATPTQPEKRKATGRARQAALRALARAPEHVEEFTRLREDYLTRMRAGEVVEGLTSADGRFRPSGPVPRPKPPKREPRRTVRVRAVSPQPDVLTRARSAVKWAQWERDDAERRARQAEERGWSNAPAWWATVEKKAAKVTRLEEALASLEERLEEAS